MLIRLLAELLPVVEKITFDNETSSTPWKDSGLPLAAAVDPMLREISAMLTRMDANTEAVTPKNPCGAAPTTFSVDTEAPWPFIAMSLVQLVVANRLPKAG